MSFTALVFHDFAIKVVSTELQKFEKGHEDYKRKQRLLAASLLHSSTKGYIFENFNSQDQLPRVEIAIQTSVIFDGENDFGEDVMNRVSVATSNQDAILVREEQEKQEQQQLGTSESESK